MKNITKVYIIDTSALLSGKPINIEHGKMVTTPGVSSELKPGGRDYRQFQFLQEKGLDIHLPTKESTKKIIKTAIETGDKNRLSTADIEILALALDFSKDDDKQVIILTDDYSIQNVAYSLDISFQNISQKGITKKFKWLYRCPGCGKRFKESIKICPICGKETKLALHQKNDICRSRYDE